EGVSPDGEAVEALGELFGQDHVGRDLAHHVDLEAVLVTLAAVVGQRLEGPVGLLQRATEGNHDDHVGEASSGSNCRPPTSAAYSFVLKSLIRTITGFG